jgi:hypothetical protein
MLVCLTILISSVLIFWLTMFNPDTIIQGIVSLFTAIISGIVFATNYSKDIAVSIMNFLSRSSLR